MNTAGKPVDGTPNWRRGGGTCPSSPRGPRAESTFPARRASASDRTPLPGPEPGGERERMVDSAKTGVVRLTGRRQPRQRCGADAAGTAVDASAVDLSMTTCGPRPFVNRHDEGRLVLQRPVQCTGQCQPRPHRNTGRAGHRNPRVVDGQGGLSRWGAEFSSLHRPTGPNRHPRNLALVEVGEDPGQVAAVEGGPNQRETVRAGPPGPTRSERSPQGEVSAGKAVTVVLEA